MVFLRHVVLVNADLVDPKRSREGMLLRSDEEVVVVLTDLEELTVDQNPLRWQGWPPSIGQCLVSGR